MSWNSSANICPRDPDKSSPRLKFTKALRCQINPSKWRESIAGSFHVSIDDVDKLERLAKAATWNLSVAWHRFLTTKINIRRSWQPRSTLLLRSIEFPLQINRSFDRTDIFVLRNTTLRSCINYGENYVELKRDWVSSCYGQKDRAQSSGIKRWDFRMKYLCSKVDVYIFYAILSFSPADIQNNEINWICGHIRPCLREECFFKT